MKEAVTKVIDTLIQEDFHGTFQKLLERYNKCTAARGDYFEGDKNFMCVLSIKVPIWKKSGNLFNDPRLYIYIYIYIHTHKHTIQLKDWKFYRFGFVFGISTLVGYSMPNPVYTYIYMICKHKSTKLNSSKYCYVSLTIELNISHLFTHS